MIVRHGVISLGVTLLMLLAFTQGAAAEGLSIGIPTAVAAVRSISSTTDASPSPSGAARITNPSSSSPVTSTTRSIASAVQTASTIATQQATQTMTATTGLPPGQSVTTNVTKTVVQTVAETAKPPVTSAASSTTKTVSQAAIRAVGSNPVKPVNPTPTPRVPASPVKKIGAVVHGGGGQPASAVRRATGAVTNAVGEDTKPVFDSIASATPLKGVNTFAGELTTQPTSAIVTTIQDPVGTVQSVSDPVLDPVLGIVRTSPAGPIVGSTLDPVLGLVSPTQAGSGGLVSDGAGNASNPSRRPDDLPIHDAQPTLPPIADVPPAMTTAAAPSPTVAMVWEEGTGSPVGRVSKTSAFDGATAQEGEGHSDDSWRPERSLASQPHLSATVSPAVALTGAPLSEPFGWPPIGTLPSGLIGSSAGLTSVTAASNGASGSSSAGLATFAALLLVTWRAIRRQILRIPSDMTRSIPIPPG